jgi:integrase
MKGLYQRGGVWWYRFTRGRRQVRVTLGTRDEAEAIRLAQRVRAMPELVVDAGDDPIDGYCRHLATGGRTRMTIAARRATLGALQRTAGVEMSRVTPAHAAGWFDGVRNDCAGSTSVVYLQQARHFFDWMVSTGRMLRNPMEGIEPPLVKPAARRRVLTEAEAARLFEKCRDEGMRFALFCALHAGLRKDEIVNARPEWFDLAAGLLHIQATGDWHPKDRANRTIPLTDEFKTFLRGYGLPSPFMLPGRREARGRWRYRYDFRRPFVNLLAECKINGATFHDLRRTFASRLVSRGVSIYKVARWLGDGLAVVERHYGFLQSEDAEINLVSRLGPTVPEIKKQVSGTRTTRRARPAIKAAARRSPHSIRD